MRIHERSRSLGKDVQLRVFHTILHVFWPVGRSRLPSVSLSQQFVTMSGPYDYPMSIPPLDHFDRSYPMYNVQYGSFQRPPGPTTPQEGFAFWYRAPDAQESIYGGDPSMYTRGMPMQSVTMQDQAARVESLSIKHRRTRSGCFTCRARRVKVRRPPSLGSITNKRPQCDETRPICDSKWCLSQASRLY